MGQYRHHRRRRRCCCLLLPRHAFRLHFDRWLYCYHAVSNISLFLSFSLSFFLSFSLSLLDMFQIFTTIQDTFCSPDSSTMAARKLFFFPLYSHYRHSPWRFPVCHYRAQYSDRFFSFLNMKICPFFSITILAFYICTISTIYYKYTLVHIFYYFVLFCFVKFSTHTCYCNCSTAPLPFCLIGNCADIHR